MTLWCKHQNLPRDTVRFFVSSGPLEWDATAAGQGWSPGELVVLDALAMEEVLRLLGSFGWDFSGWW